MSSGKYGQLVVISRSGADGKAFPMHTTRVVLKNLSENCTSVNTHVLEAGQQRALKSGDVITIVGRSLRYEENRNSSSETTTPQGSSRAPNVPQTVGVANGGVGGGRPPLVFASGGGPDGQQRQLRRRLSRTPRNPDTARKLKLWDAHYSGTMSVETTSDIFAESPPSGLLDISQRLLAEPDDPFAASSTHGEGAFERMAQSVGRGSEASVRRDPGVTAEVAKIMGQISQMAAQNKSPSRMTTPLQSGRKRPRSPTDAAVSSSERRRSRSLERVQQPAGQRQMYPPLLPQKPASAGAAAYGSEDETSRGTVGVSPQSTYNRSPTLQRQRQGGSQSVVVQRSKPIQRAGSTTARTPELQRTPAQFFSSLPRPVNGSSSVVGRRAASSGSPTPVASLSSPLKRTLSSNSNCGARPPIMPPRPILPADDESEEVPTEPEPESESESDAEPAAVVTPENRAGGRPLLLAQESMARKSVRFGPALSPEVFDVGAPPSTPLRRGTPMQMPARASSILRRTSPTRPQPAAAERQARIQGTSPESSFVAGDFSLGVSSRLAGLSVTTPPPTPTPTTTPTTLSSTPQQSRKLRRQTIADFAPTTEAEEQSVDEILAHRQRLRRIQDRKRRRQTVADLNKRRSSWRGWMPSANLVDSPPSSPEPHHVADWSTPRVSIKGKEDNASSLVSPTNTLMYPPTAWNTEGESPTKRRRMRGIADIVVSVLGMSPKPASIELANDPKHGTRQPAPAAEPKAFAYPPRPVPIDADWEKIDVDNAEERLAKEKEAAAEQDIVAEASSQQVELYAVSGPASDVDSASLFSAHLPTEQEPVLPIEREEQEPVLPTEEVLPAVVVEAPTSTVLSPPTTRGRASRSQRQTSESVSPPPPPPPNITAAVKRTTTPRPPPPAAAPLSTRRRAATTTAAVTAPTMTRKRRAEDPAPVAQPIKRGRGRPPANGIRKTPEPSSVMSPPATRASKRKSHAT
ncbi:hypothetical protein H4R27_005396 [Coemansia aciculifera]|nr:hypothetical protein H4R27_005396 [Coemansia aciculifera]